MKPGSPFLLFLLISFLLHTGFALYRTQEPPPLKIDFEDGATALNVRLVEWTPPAQPPEPEEVIRPLAAPSAEKQVIVPPEPVPQENPKPIQLEENPPTPESKPEPEPEPVVREAPVKKDNPPAAKPRTVGAQSKTRPASVVRSPKPPYPRSALRRGIENVTTVVQVQIDSNGRVRSATLARSCGRADMDRSALGTIKRAWRFRPASRNGTPVPTSTTIRIHWRID